MKPTLTIIGGGRVGQTLGRLLHRQADVSIADVINRSRARARDAVEFIGAGRAGDGLTDLAPATIFLLAVPDDRISEQCEQLARSGGLSHDSVVFHCSGALDSDALRSAAARGAHVASIHPVRSFADPARVATHFAGTLCGTEGTPAALVVLQPLFEAIGARLVPLPAASKTLYHAAAVFASNYIVSTLAVAQQTYVAAGIAPELALEMATTLAREAVDNVARLGPASALTGPIARGDSITVARQQHALDAWNREAAALYAALAAATKRLAASGGRSV